MRTGEAIKGDMDRKYFRPPFEVYDDCPKCGQESSYGFSSGRHLEYVDLGKPKKLYFVCDDEDCLWEWEKHVTFKATVEMVEVKKPRKRRST